MSNSNWTIIGNEIAPVLMGEVRKIDNIVEINDRFLSFMKEKMEFVILQIEENEKRALNIGICLQEAEEMLYINDENEPEMMMVEEADLFLRAAKSEHDSLRMTYPEFPFLNLLRSKIFVISHLLDIIKAEQNILPLEAMEFRWVENKEQEEWFEEPDYESIQGVYFLRRTLETMIWQVTELLKDEKRSKSRLCEFLLWEIESKIDILLDLQKKYKGYKLAGDTIRMVRKLKESEEFQRLEESLEK